MTSFPIHYREKMSKEESDKTYFSKSKKYSKIARGGVASLTFLLLARNLP
jgi:hypothetical protein